VDRCVSEGFFRAFLGKPILIIVETNKDRPEFAQMQIWSGIYLPSYALTLSRPMANDP
jgi:hypothetical protein